MSFVPSDIHEFEHPHLTTDVVVLALGASPQDNYRKLAQKRLEVLLVKRDAPPYQGCWTLPGGFVDPGQTARRCALAKLAQKTGVTQTYLEQLYTFSDPGRDPRGWVVSCSHLALIDKHALKSRQLDPHARWFAATLDLAAQDCETVQAGRIETRTYTLSLTCDDADLPAPVRIEGRVDHVTTTSRQPRGARRQGTERAPALRPLEQPLWPRTRGARLAHPTRPADTPRITASRGVSAGRQGR